jgi:hypothetical protein
MNSKIIFSMQFHNFSALLFILLCVNFYNKKRKGDEKIKNIKE